MRAPSVILRQAPHALCLLLLPLISARAQNTTEVEVSTPAGASTSIVINHLAPEVADADNNGLLDTWELQYFGRTGVDPAVDADDDGLSNLMEQQAGTNPVNADTDDDGLLDGQEVALGTDPRDPASKGVLQVAWQTRQTTTIFPVPVTGPGDGTGGALLGITAFLGNTLYGRFDWHLTRTGAGEGNGEYDFSMQASGNPVGWTVTKNFASLPDVHTGINFWGTIPQGQTYYPSLPFSWEGFGGFGNMPASFVNSANYYGGEIAPGLARWTEAFPYLDASGQQHTYTSAIEARLSGPPLTYFESTPAQVSKGPWTGDSPTATHSDTMAVTAEYRIMVPPGMTGTIHWFEVFDPDGSASASVRAHSWTINGTQSLVYTLGSTDGANGSYSMVFDPSLDIDINHDGHINSSDSFADGAISLTPNLADDRHGSTYQPNYADDVINGAADLKHFSPVYLDIAKLLAVLPPSDSVHYKLKQEDGAVNFVYTNLTGATALAYLDGSLTTGFGPGLTLRADGATTQQITAAGVDIFGGSTGSPAFLSAILNNNGGVILIESRQISNKPLVLEIISNDQSVLTLEIATKISVGELAVDANRDGVIKFASEDASDATTSATPYRFWLNDDIDRGHTVDGDDHEEDDMLASPDGELDWQENRIPSMRDLEDFFRLWINSDGLNFALKSGELFLGLEWRNVTGTPAIKLYRHFATDGGPTYLTEEVIADQQISGSLALGQFNQAIADQRDPNNVPVFNGNPAQTLIEGSSVFVLPTWLFSNLDSSTTRTCLLMEGCKPGQGQLQLVVLRKDGESYTKIGEGSSAWMNLEKIDDMYERWTVSDTNGGVAWTTASRKKVHLSASGDATGHEDGFAYGTSALEVNQYILFVHGWNMQPWEKNRYAETMFKRLYWQGYKGRFGVFCWPTTYGFDSDIDAVRNSTNYDQGEWTAWRAATPLKNLLVDLKITYSDQVYIMAHSMGNIVAGEALQLAAIANTGTLVNTYVASQAAIPEHVYDSSRADDLAPIFSFSTSIGRAFDGSNFPETPNIYRGWLATNSGAVSTRISFYNENDYALWHDAWELNQFFKPDQPDAPKQPYIYRFFGNIETSDPDNFAKIDGAMTLLTLGDRFNVHDRYEIMAFAAEARTMAVGSTKLLPNFRGVNLQGVDADGKKIWPADDQSVKLHDGLTYSAHKWHSAQFRSTNMRQKGYWAELLGRNGFNLSITTP